MTGQLVPTANILLVDDRPENLVALKGILKNSTYHLLTASSGEEALELALREKLALILLDVAMPRMDGFEVARYLKQTERTHEIPILFLTAVATDVQQIYRAYDVGAVDYLIKPLDADMVRKKVAVFVELMRQKEEIKRQAQVLREQERREHQVRLREMRLAGDRRYRRLVEGIDHAIAWTIDRELHVTFFNGRAERVLGCPQAEFMTPDFWPRHLHPEDRDDVLSLFRRALADEEIELRIDHRMLGAGGRERWFHTSVCRTEDEAGHPELHGLSVDVGELKEAEATQARLYEEAERARQEAERARQAREDLLAVVSHDLRNPLSTILTSVGLLSRVGPRADDPQRLEKVTRAIFRAAERMERLIGDLLAFAQLEAGRLTVEVKPVDAGSLLQESLEVLRPLAEEKKVILRSQTLEPLRLCCDRDRVLQILSNLVGNAIKFTPEGGMVSISAQRLEAEAQIAVADTGPGIPQEQLSQMWERFWQAKRRTDGSIGLGLSIAKGLVEAQAGRIWADSTVGQGTTFSFTLPLDEG